MSHDKAIWLRTLIAMWLGKRWVSVSHWIHVGSVLYIWKYNQPGQQYLSLLSLKLSWLLKGWKYNGLSQQVMLEIQQNCFKHEADRCILMSTDLLSQNGKTKNFLNIKEKFYWVTNLTHNSFYMFIWILYMFRATLCSSSGGQLY